MQDNGNTIAVTTVEESEQLQSAAAGYIVYGFEVLLVLILLGIAIYLFSSKRKKGRSNKFERPQHYETNINYYNNDSGFKWSFSISRKYL